MPLSTPVKTSIRAGWRRWSVCRSASLRSGEATMASKSAALALSGENAFPTSSESETNTPSMLGRYHDLMNFSSVGAQHSKAEMRVTVSIVWRRDRDAVAGARGTAYVTCDASAQAKIAGCIGGHAAGSIAGAAKRRYTTRGGRDHDHATDAQRRLENHLPAVSLHAGQFRGQDRGRACRRAEHERAETRT